MTITTTTTRRDGVAETSFSFPDPTDDTDTDRDPETDPEIVTRSPPKSNHVVLGPPLPLQKNSSKSVQQNF